MALSHVIPMENETVSFWKRTAQAPQARAAQAADFRALAAYDL